MIKLKYKLRLIPSYLILISNNLTNNRIWINNNNNNKFNNTKNHNLHSINKRIINLKKKIKRKFKVSLLNHYKAKLNSNFLVTEKSNKQN